MSPEETKKLIFKSGGRFRFKVVYLKLLVLLSIKRSFKCKTDLSDSTNSTMELQSSGGKEVQCIRVPFLEQVVIYDETTAEWNEHDAELMSEMIDRGIITFDKAI